MKLSKTNKINIAAIVINIISLIVTTYLDLHNERDNITINNYYNYESNHTLENKTMHQYDKFTLLRDN